VVPEGIFAKRWTAPPGQVISTDFAMLLAPAPHELESYDALPALSLIVIC